MEKTRVTHVSAGFMFLGFLIDRSIVGSGKWAPRIRIPANAVEKVRRKMQAALAPETHRDSVRARILGLNSIVGGWCRDYQTTSSPAYYFDKLANELFLGMAHWLGRKYELSMPQVMRRFRKGNTSEPAAPYWADQRVHGSATQAPNDPKSVHSGGHQHSTRGIRQPRRGMDGN